MSHKTPPQKSQRPLAGMFFWLVPALKSPRKWKTWIRSCLVLAATMILLVDNVTSQSMGTAGFFAPMVAFMLPPSLPLSLFILAIGTLLVGMLIGWAWGAAAMASALNVRNQALLAQQLQQAQSSLVQGIPVQLQFQQFMFQGRFLDPRSSAVYGAFIFIGSFALAAMAAKLPNLTLLSIFGMIVLDIMCSYGPLFYKPRYTLAKLFLIPTSYYVAIALISLALIFPESLNHSWLKAFNDGVLKRSAALMSIQSKALSLRPSDRKAWAILAQEAAEIRKGLIGGAQGLLGQIGLIDLECSVGRLGSMDLKRVGDELRSLLSRVGGLVAFQDFVNESNLADEREEADLDKLESKRSTKLADRFTTFRRQIRERELQHSHDLENLIPILASSSVELRTACETVLKDAEEWFTDCNSHRWRRFFSNMGKEQIESRQNKLVNDLSALRRAVNQFETVDRVRLIEPYRKYFDPETGKLLDLCKGSNALELFSARSLFTCFVYCDTLLAFTERLEKLLMMMIDLDKKRPNPRIWFPSGFGKLGRKLRGNYDVENAVAPLAMGTSTNPTQFPIDEDVMDGSTLGGEPEFEEETDAEPHHPRNPDALPPKTALGRFAIKLGSVVRWFGSDEGIFSLRTAIVSVALWIPAVCTSSAAFNYDHKGLWALIMAQTGLAVYAGDQIGGFILRIIGTAIGLLLGMAVWYIGAGRGDGNPYGVVIATTVIISPFVFARIAAPQQDIMIWLMTVTGYSWIDTHFVQPSNPGVGVNIGWQRALLVIIGFTASFIVMLFPRPTSSRTLVRRTLAATTEELGHIFATVVEAILAEESRARRGILEKPTFVGDPTGGETSERISPKERRVRNITQKLMNVATRLQGLELPLMTGKWEPQIQGLWPQEHYTRLHLTQRKLLAALDLLIGGFVRLDTKWCSRFVHKTPYMNPNFLADVFSNVAILSHALSGGHPLPASLPKLRDRILYHDRHLFAHATDRLGQRDTGAPTELQVELDSAPEKVDGVSIGVEEISLDLLMDDQFPSHSTIVIAMSSIIRLFDEASDVIRVLCGETTWEGVNLLHQDYLAREEKALGG